MSADYVVKLPDSIGYETPHQSCCRASPRNIISIAPDVSREGGRYHRHPCGVAGGVGMLACQWAKALGATVIGTVGSDEKAELAKAHGCDYPIVYTRENFTQRVRGITNGAGVPVVYDSIGKDTYISASFDCLAPLGLFVSFGNSSGPIPPIDSSELAGRGSLYFTQPTLFSYIAKRGDLDTMAAEFVRGRIVGQGEDERAAAICAVRCGEGAWKRARRPARPYCCRNGIAGRFVMTTHKKMNSRPLPSSSSKTKSRFAASCACR